MDAPLSNRRPIRLENQERIKEVKVDTEHSYLMRLPRELRCQIISEMRDAEQLYFLYQSDVGRKLHKLIIDCAKQVIVDLSSRYLTDIVPFLLILENLTSVIMVYTRQGTFNYQPITITQLMEVAKLKNLREFIFEYGDYDEFSQLTFLANYCCGLTTIIDELGIIKVQRLNRNFDNVHFVFPFQFSLDNNIIRSSDWQTQLMIINKLKIVKGITVLDTAMGSILDALRWKMIHIEVVEIRMKTPTEYDLAILFQQAPIRILRANFDQEQIILFGEILLRLPTLDTLREILLLLPLDHLARVVERYYRVHTLMVTLRAAELESGPALIEEVLSANPQIKRLIVDIDSESLPEDYDDELLAIEALIAEVRNSFNEEFLDRIEVTYQ